MRPVFLCTMALVLPGLLGDVALGQTKPTASKDPYTVKLPIPDYEIPCDLTVWKTHFQIMKTTFDKDENQVVFLLKAKHAFKFTDDGFTAPLRFFDEDGVNLVKDTNLKFDPDPKTLKVGELTRCYLTVPDEDVLKKTKKTQAVLKGFFTKDKNEK